MKYIDTDILIHSIIIQDIEKHNTSKSIILKSIENDEFFISLLTLQELAFVLDKLAFEKSFIDKNISELLKFKPVNYNINHFSRAIQIANIIGFQNINDCLHLSLAEYYCSELLTYNKKDFAKIKKYTDIKITIL